MRDNLALIAGVGPEDVVVDSAKRRAIVMAKPLPGASLQTYQALEQRMVSQMPDWAINIQPPPTSLPELVVAEGELTSASKTKMELISWAALRSPMTMSMSGSQADLDVVATEMAKQNLFFSNNKVDEESRGRVRFVWMMPESGEQETE